MILTSQSSISMDLEQRASLWHDVESSHVGAWRRGRALFGFPRGTCPPDVRGMLVGEAPGPNTDPRLPLFPAPGNSAGARLLRYAGIDPVDWFGKLLRVNLCDGPWSLRRATVGRARVLSYLLDEANFYDGAPLRVLLLGTRVASAWGCRGSFGYEEHQYGLNPIATFRMVPSDKTLHVAWIPHPSGRNLLYNVRRNQSRAKRSVLWAIGERDTP